MSAKALEITDDDVLDLQPVRQSASLALQSPDPLVMVQRAIDHNWDLDRLQKVMELAERYQANVARNAFEDAMAAFKAETIVILKDKTNKQYASKYVSLGNLVATVTPYLSKHGLSATWDIDQSSGIRVACVITHRLGHSKSCAVNFPADKSGAKNPIQEIKSAITYAKACTFESVCGLASTDAHLDDDGNGAGPRHLSEDDVKKFTGNIISSANIGELHKAFAEAFKAAKAIGDEASMQKFTTAKDSRKGVLQG